MRCCIRRTQETTSRWIHSEDMDNGEVQYEGLEDDRLIQKVYRLFCKRNGI